MKTGVSLCVQDNSGFAPFAAKDFDLGLDWAQRLGVDAVELIIRDPNTVDADKLMKKLVARGLALATLATGQMAGEGLMFTNESPETRAAAVKRICDHIDLSLKIGKPNVTIGLARGKGSDNPDTLAKQVVFVRDCVKRCGEYAGQKNIVINLEPLNRYETHILHTSEETLQMIKDVGCESSIGILYDTFHSSIEDADMTAVIASHITSISHIHFADSNRRVPGYGHTNFAAIVALLKKLKYSGYISLEVLNNPSSSFVIDHADMFVKIVTEK